MCELLNAQKASESNEGEGQNTDKDGLVCGSRIYKYIFMYIYICWFYSVIVCGVEGFVS